MRFAVWGGRRYPKALLRVPFLFVKREKVILKEKEKEKERSFFHIVRSLKMLSNVSIRLRVSPRVVKMISSRVPVLKTPFSEPVWQDPEFLRKVRGLEGMLRVRKSLEGAGGCASGWLAAENDSGGQQVKPVSGTNNGDVGFSRASSARRGAGENAPEGHLSARVTVHASAGESKGTTV